MPAPIVGMFYQAVVAAVLLYGSETWVVPPHYLRALEGFHVEAARRITGMRPTKRGEKWFLPQVRELTTLFRSLPVIPFLAPTNKGGVGSLAASPPPCTPPGWVGPR